MFPSKMGKPRNRAVKIQAQNHTAPNGEAGMIGCDEQSLEFTLTASCLRKSIDKDSHESGGGVGEGWRRCR